jgi:hypothetical protein
LTKKFFFLDKQEICINVSTRGTQTLNIVRLHSLNINKGTIDLVLNGGLYFVPPKKYTQIQEVRWILSTISDKLAIFPLKRILFLSSHIFQQVDNQNTWKNLLYLKPLKMLLKAVKFWTSSSSQDSRNQFNQEKIVFQTVFAMHKRRINDYAIRNDGNKTHSKFDDCLLEYPCAKDSSELEVYLVISASQTLLFYSER